MALTNCPFYNLLLQETEPEQKFLNHAVARLEKRNVDLSLFMKDQSVHDCMILRPAQTIARLCKVFDKLDKKNLSYQVSVDIFKNIAAPIIRIQNGPFSLTQCIELAGSALPIVTNHLTVYLREVLTLLLEKKNIFEQLLASEKYAEVIQRWVTSKQHQQLLGQAAVENLAERTLHLCNACPGDHGINDSCTEWSNIQELMHQLEEFAKPVQVTKKDPTLKQENIMPLSKMRALDPDAKKTNQTHARKEFEFPSFIKEGLEKLHIPMPRGMNGLASTKEHIQQKIPQLISAAVDSFPCRLCSERLAGVFATLPTMEDDHNDYPIATTAEQINLYGERVGAWKVLLSDMAMEKIKKLIGEGKLPQVEYNLRELAQGRGWKKRTRQVPHGSKVDSMPVIPLRYSPLPGEIFILWQVDVGYYDELTARKQFGQIIKVWDMVNREQVCLILTHSNFTHTYREP
jgi:hypothetical protein